MYQLEEKVWFWAFVVIPIVSFLFLAGLLWKRRVQRKFASKALLEKLSPNQSVLKSVLKLIVWCLAISFLIIAMVNPKIGSKLETVKREGVDIVFAVDVSKSMLAEDIAPNRLEKAKQLVTQIINNLASDRVGIIAYAGSAFPQLPITTDYSAAKLFLQNMNTDLLSSQGTAINQAIDLSATYFDNAQQTNRVLIILSDGEDHNQDAESAAEAASEKGIRIFTIGIGDTNGGPIPLKQNGVVLNYKKDKDGETVITRLDEENLMRIANAANGMYVYGKNTDYVIEEISNILQSLDKTEFEAKQVADFKDQFQWFIALALILLALDVFLLERKTSWLRQLNLFNEKKKKV